MTDVTDATGSGAPTLESRVDVLQDALHNMRARVIALDRALKILTLSVLCLIAVGWLDMRAGVTP